MRTKLRLAFALTVVLAAGARAQTPVPDAPAATPQPSEKIICVRGQAETGSHFGASKVCHTESEWAMIHNQSSRTMEHYDALQNRQPVSTGGR
ncbi:MAG TPA: hypothetical protein VNX61_14190 [Rhizomicrobium sp.]|jgi:hypothetical protein|nr:hypothetical protein [Rhizomicrobium sp.]